MNCSDCFADLPPSIRCLEYAGYMRLEKKSSQPASAAGWGLMMAVTILVGGKVLSTVLARVNWECTSGMATTLVAVLPLVIGLVYGGGKLSEALSLRAYAQARVRLRPDSLRFDYPSSTMAQMVALAIFCWFLPWQMMKYSGTTHFVSVALVILAAIAIFALLTARQSSVEVSKQGMALKTMLLLPWVRLRAAEVQSMDIEWHPGSRSEESLRLARGLKIITTGSTIHFDLPKIDPAVVEATGTMLCQQVSAYRDTSPATLPPEEEAGEAPEERLAPEGTAAGHER